MYVNFLLEEDTVPYNGAIFCIRQAKIFYPFQVLCELMSDRNQSGDMQVNSELTYPACVHSCLQNLSEQRLQSFLAGSCLMFRAALAAALAAAAYIAKQTALRTYNNKIFKLKQYQERCTMEHRVVLSQSRCTKKIHANELRSIKR